MVISVMCIYANEEPFKNDIIVPLKTSQTMFV